MGDHDRLHALDAVRAFALLTGIILHASMSFLPALAEGMWWPIVDRSLSPALQAVFYVIHIFRMTTFYFIAGFFAHMMFHRKGAAAFLQDRAKRILVPLLVGWTTVGPLVILALVWGTKISGRKTPAAGALDQDVFPLLHLWFLYYLLLFYAVILVLRGCVAEFLDRQARMRSRFDAWLRWIVRGHAAVPALAAPLALCLYFLPDEAMFGGIPTPNFTLTPQLPALVGYGTAFAFGWLLHRQSSLLQVWRKRWLPNLALALASTAASYAIVVSSSGSAATNALKMAYAAGYSVAMWAWVIAIVGAALRFFSKMSAAWRYVSDSSYWLYLVHLPLVIALQVTVMQWNLHWSVKFPSIVLAATALLLLSYHFLVRFTYIGEVLNGRRRRRSDRSSADRAASEPGIVPRAASGRMNQGDAAVAELSGVRKRYGKTVALDGVDLRVPGGNLLAILGPNGAGKTTAISLLLGLQEPDEGTATLFGESPHLIEARRKVGVMMQEVTLAAELRARDLVELTASYYPLPMSTDEVIKLTNITALARRPYGKLSGGQKRQVQFAMALVGRPGLLFLDEPTAGLDVQAREMMWALLRRLVDGGTSIVLTTHYLEEAEALADRVAVLAKGRLVALGSVNEVRALVARKQIRCVTALDLQRIASWPGVQNVSRVGQQIHITAIEAESTVRLLLENDAGLRELEVSRAGLAEAFAEVTQEAAS